MKITKEQLKQIIKEELENIQEARSEDNLINAAIGYHKQNPVRSRTRLGPINDLEVIAGGREMPEVASWSTDEAQKLLLIIRALDKFSTGM